MPSIGSFRLQQHRSIAQEVTHLLSEVLETPKPLSILDLKGLGKEHWRGVRSVEACRAITSLVGLMADLGRGPAGVDTVVFIYFIEEHPQFLPLLEPLFREVDDGRRELVTSALTLLEVLVVPYRSGDYLLAGRYGALLTQSRGVRVAEISRSQLRAAAQLRATTGVKTPDSLRLVAALAAGCSTFLTNDRDLPGIPGLRVLQLSSYVK
jgi:predicted nucleic acid-binding protein